MPLGLLSIYKDIFSQKIASTQECQVKLCQDSCYSLGNLKQIFNLKWNTGLNKIGSALYLYKDLKVLSLLQAEHLESPWQRFWTLRMQT